MLGRSNRMVRAVFPAMLLVLFSMMVWTPVNLSEKKLLSKQSGPIRKSSAPPNPNPSGVHTSKQRSSQMQQITNSLGMEFVLIPPGTFKMGSNNGDSDEKPVHRVTISRDFYMGIYEVTQEQWQVVMGNNPSYIKGNYLPIEEVTWDDSQEFIRRLNAKEGQGLYRLPTEAEWEYACRAGTTGDRVCQSNGNRQPGLRLRAIPF